MWEFVLKVRYSKKYVVGDKVCGDDKLMCAKGRSALLAVQSCECVSCAN